MKTRRIFLSCLPAAAVAVPLAASAFRFETVAIDVGGACDAGCTAPGGGAAVQAMRQEQMVTEVSRVMQLQEMQARCRFCGFLLRDGADHGEAARLPND